MIEARPQERLDPKPSHFSKAVVTTLIARLVMVAGALGTSITVGRWLGAEGLGSLAVINITIALGVQFGCFGIPSANTYFISQNNRDLPKVWHISLLFAGVFGSLIALAIAMGATWRPGAFGNVNPTLLAVAAI